MKRYVAILFTFALYTNGFSQIQFTMFKHRVQGVVTDENKQPMPGVSVYSDRNNGTITDMNGQYRIDINDTATLYFSFVGYKPQQIKPQGTNEINVQMAPDIIELFESCTAPSLYISAGLLMNSNGMKGGKITIDKVNLYCNGSGPAFTSTISFKSALNCYSFGLSAGCSNLNFYNGNKFGFILDYNEIHREPYDITNIKGTFLHPKFLKLVGINEMVGFQQYNNRNNIGLGAELKWGHFFRKPHMAIALTGGAITWCAYEEYNIQALLSKNLSVKNTGLIRINAGFDYKTIKSYREIYFLLRFDFLAKTITYI